MSIKEIDVSNSNDGVDWGKAKAAGLRVLARVDSAHIKILMR